MLTGEEIMQLQQMVRRVPVAPHVIHYALRLVGATRVHEGDVPAFIKDWVSWGAGPRGMQYLLLGGKARAMLNGRLLCDDRRHQGRGSPRAAAPRDHQLQRRIGGHHVRTR